jgi:multidrug efflux pump subunit AcrA (membrane-fusion protein)
MRSRAGFTVLLALVLAGCGGAKKESDEAAEATPVQVAKVSRQSIRRVVTADAVLYPISQSGVAPKISAPVRRFLVNRGDHVRAGELLAELEDRDLTAAVSENKALYEQAQAQFLTTTKGTLPEDMTKAQADVDSARQGLDAAKKLYENRVSLVKEGALAQKLADDAKVALVQAQSQFDTAQRHLESLKTVSRQQEIQSAQSQVDAAKARYSSAEAQVEYAGIRSPIDGIVADRPANAGEMASSGTALITIVDISSIVARANVPVREIGHLKVGQNATIAAPEGELQGKVTVVSPAVDPASTTVEVWVRAANPGEKLKPGVTAKVSILAETVPDAVVVPAAALLSSDEGETEVMTVGADSIAHEQKVETGVREGGQVQITEGLNGGENVVTVGGVGLADKSKVHVEANAPARE